MAKTLKEATLGDNFLFSQTLQNEDVCRALLKEVLGKDIGRIEYVNREEDKTDTFDYRGIRLDVYVKGEDTVYDVEMQNVNKRDLERRCRFYQAGIDRSLLDKGADFSELPESYIIFVCNFDYYGVGNLVYEKESRIKDIGAAYNDGSHVIFLNAKFDPNKQTEETKPLQEFLSLINNSEDTLTLQSELGRVSATEIRKIKSNEEMGEQYMTFCVMLNDSRRTGLEEGRKEGKIEGTLTQAISSVKKIMRKYNESLDTAIDSADVPQHLRKQVKETILSELTPSNTEKTSV